MLPAHKAQRIVPANKQYPPVPFHHRRRRRAYLRHENSASFKPNTIRAPACHSRPLDCTEIATSRNIPQYAATQKVYDPMPFAAQRSLRAMNWLLAALFVAAALRGLVPGMCATLSAAADAAAEEAPAACCAMELAPAEDADHPAYTPVPAKHPPCAFCNAAFAQVVTADTFVVPIPAGRLACEIASHPCGAPKTFHADGARLGRAPPTANA